MSRLTSLRAVLPLAVVLFQAAPILAGQDATAILNEVSQRYSVAKSYRIEAVEERTSSSELNRDWQKTFMTAVVSPGGRYRYEGRSFIGHAILVSDGTREWEYLPDQKTYTEKTASADDSDKKRIRAQDEMAALNAKAIVSNLGRLGGAVKSATFLPDEKISIGTQTIDCYVLHVSDDDFKTRRPARSREETFWIDKSRRVIVKKIDRDNPLSDAPVNGHLPFSSEDVVTYPVARLDEPEDATLFAFVAPKDAQLVAELSSLLVPGPHFEFIGKPAADLHLKSTDGTVMALSSLRGQPVFLDFWATWCGPCKGMVPDLIKLHDETALKGLVWVGIDNDENPEAANKFIAQQHIPWMNYHDLDGSFGAAFQRQVIPLGVLIDARGNVAFYQTAYEVRDLRAAIARLGPEFQSIAVAMSGK
ncbi:MAG: TlpA disulfide reductase family protein [Candidatus Sulfotelmatobacter sp.]